MIMLSTRLSPLWNKVANFIIAAVLVAIPAYVANDYFRTQQRPRIIKNIWLEPPVMVAVPDKPIEFTVHIEANISRPCRTQVQRWVVRAGDNKPVWTAIEQGRPTQVSESSRISVPVRIEESLVPDDYYYKSVVYDTCDGPRGEETFTTSPPFVYFRVVGGSSR